VTSTKDHDERIPTAEGSHKARGVQHWLCSSMLDAVGNRMYVDLPTSKGVDLAKNVKL